MSNTVNTYNNQNLMDIAIQETGSIESIFELALDNGMSVSDVIVPGAALIVKTAVVDQVVYDYFKKFKIKPSNGSLDIKTKCMINDKRIDSVDVNGTYNLDHKQAGHWVIEMDGDTILTDSNLPTGINTSEFTMRIKKNGFALTVPSYWGNANGDEEDGTEWVLFTVQIENGNSGSEKCTMFLTNLA